MLSGTRLAELSETGKSVQNTAPDIESLLVEFLQELLYLGEVHGLAFDKFEIAVEDLAIEAKLAGSPVASIQKEIKAVTYHNLKVVETGHGLEVRLVFDV